MKEIKDSFLASTELITLTLKKEEQNLKYDVIFMGFFLNSIFAPLWLHLHDYFLLKKKKKHFGGWSKDIDFPSSISDGFKICSTSESI